MKFQGFLALMGEQLFISSKDCDWMISLRRDGGDTRFGAFDKKAVSPSDVKKLLPNWESLNWKELKLPAFLGREIHAVHGEMHVGLQLGSSKKAKDDVTAEFVSWLEGK